MIHGCIDGYSSFITYLKCATTIELKQCQYFSEAIERYGLPSCVCADRGGETIQVAEFMLAHPEQGTGRGSFITGCSVHNSRIERYYGEMCFKDVPYYTTTFSIEWKMKGYLINPDNTIHLHVLSALCVSSTHQCKSTAVH